MVWNNRLRVFQAGIYKLSSRLGESNTRFLSFNEFFRKFNVKRIFFTVLRSPSGHIDCLEKHLTREQLADTVNLIAIDKLTCKTINES